LPKKSSHDLCSLSLLQRRRSGSPTHRNAVDPRSDRLMRSVTLFARCDSADGRFDELLPSLRQLHHRLQQLYRRNPISGGSLDFFIYPRLLGGLHCSSSSAEAVQESTAGCS
ncbi:hypothetical protein LINPERPRIM_LOCUS3116, partial [Linum perenne]